MVMNINVNLLANVPFIFQIQFQIRIFSHVKKTVSHNSKYKNFKDGRGGGGGGHCTVTVLTAH
jgi:hypothetical protein